MLTKYKRLQKAFHQKETQSSLLVSELEEEKKKLDNVQTDLADLQTLVKTILSDTECIETENNNLKTIITEMEKELNELEDSEQNQHSIIKTKSGTKYLNSVRELYYSLLTMGITPDKINEIIRSVISNLCPNIDITNLKLPQKSCASYMRMAEMST